MRPPTNGRGHLFGKQTHFAPICPELYTLMAHPAGRVTARSRRPVPAVSRGKVPLLLATHLRRCTHTWVGVWRRLPMCLLPGCQGSRRRRTPVDTDP